MEKKKLVIATETFPYGKGEKPFLIPELEKLAEHFDITVCSHANKQQFADTENETILDDRIQVVNIDVTLGIGKRILYFIKYFLDKDGWLEIRDILSGKEQIINRIYQSVAYYALAMENLSVMKQKGVLTDNTIYYSFWCYYYTYSWSKYKKKLRQAKLVTRAHGFDLYNERYSGNRQPFKKIVTKNLDKIFFVSEAGKEYYQRNFDSGIEEKGCVCSLGSKTLEAVEHGKNNAIFTMVSCSNVIPLKRIERIIEALATLEQEQIQWIHFGDGEQRNDILQYAEKLLDKKTNIHYEFKGEINNKEILAFYQKNAVDCFITTSSTEGMPVSIMEAMSSRIPIIGTCVGGIPEMIDGNGILISEKAAIHEVVKAIKDLYYMDREQCNNMKDNSYRIWKEKFCFEDNINFFIEELKKGY